MKEILFVVGGIGGFVSTLGTVVKRITDGSNSRWANSMPPFWIFTAISFVSVVSLAVAYFYL